jgi:hypothetical protein
MPRILAAGMGRDNKLSLCMSSTAPQDDEVRDRWMYEQHRAGVPVWQIHLALLTEHTDWFPLATQSGVSKAIKRFAERNGLEYSPKPKNHATGKWYVPPKY